MLPKKWLERMTQEELYQAWLQLSEKIENDTLAQFQSDTDEVKHHSAYEAEAIELLRNPDQMHGIGCGYSDIDSRTKGFEPGELIIVGAVEGVGKSMLVQNMLHNMGMRDIPTLFISMEMTNAEAEKRYLEMTMDGSNVKYDGAVKILSDKPLHFYETENMNLDKLDEKIGSAITDQGIKLLAIDHLHYFAPQNTENSSAAIGYLVRKLKLMARKHNIPFIVISHLTKIKKKGMPDKSTLRDSSFIAQDADTVIMLDRDWSSDDEVARKTLKFDIQKNRTRGNLGRGELTITKRYKITEKTS